jgi:hypothetical protein
VRHCLPEGWRLLEDSRELLLASTSHGGCTWRILLRVELHSWVATLVRVDGCTRERITSVRARTLPEAMLAADRTLRCWRGPGEGAKGGGPRRFHLVGDDPRPRR